MTNPAWRGVMFDYVNGKWVASRLEWVRVGRISPPFFLAQMENGPREIAAVCGFFGRIVAARIRKRWINWSAFYARLEVAAEQRLRWNRNMDDYF